VAGYVQAIARGPDRKLSGESVVFPQGTELRTV